MTTSATSPRICPVCGTLSDVLYTRERDEGTRVLRRRRCPACGRRWTTQERMVPEVRLGMRSLPWLYAGFRGTGGGKKPTTVDRAGVVYLNPAGTWAPLRFAPFLPRHELKSPSGWNWGYAGSGPAELARHLLWHATGRRELLQRGALYQEFKRDVVAALPDDWVLTGEFIRAWIKEHERPEDALDGDDDERDDGDRADGDERRGARGLQLLERG